MALLRAAALVVAVDTSMADSSGDRNHFFAGYCTWDAAEQTHSAWGVWLSWSDGWRTVLTAAAPAQAPRLVAVID